MVKEASPDAPLSRTQPDPDGCSFYDVGLGRPAGWCPHRSHEDTSLCIFHLDKASASPEVVRGILAALLALLESASQEPHASLDLTGFDFPRFYLFPVTRELDRRPVILRGAKFRERFDVFSKQIVALDLEHAEFYDGCSFQTVTCHGPLILRYARVHGELMLWYSTFRAEVDATSVAVSESIKCWGSTFEMRVSLVGANLQSASLKAAKFAADLDLGRIYLSQRFELSASIVEGQFSLAGATLAGHCYIGSRQEPCTMGSLVFREVVLTRDAVVSFLRLDLARASFLHTNLQSVVFSHVVWPVRGRLWVRRCLSDEVTANADDDYEAIAENYRQLVLNHEGKRDYDVAEEFHVGEMEMRRRAAAQRRLVRLGQVLTKLPYSVTRTVHSVVERVNAYGAYRLLSRYGTSYWTALGMLVLLITLFSTGFMFVGFRSTTARQGPGVIVRYRLGMPTRGATPSAGEIAADLSRAGLLSLSVATWQRERAYEPLNDLGRWWATLALVMLGGQSALLLLAIRRRFKR